DMMQIANMTGITMNAISTVINSYQIFKQSNVEKYFGQLIETGIDLTAIGNDFELERRFYYIIDQVSRERNREKIAAWKTATISLAFIEDINLNEIDGHFQTLEYLIQFDLIVLHKIYTTDFEFVNFEKELINFFAEKEIDSEYVRKSLRQLALHNLISEQYESTAMIVGSSANLQHFHYSKNKLGRQFLNFINKE